VDARRAAHEVLQIANVHNKAHGVRLWEEGDVHALEGGAELQQRAEEEAEQRAREVILLLLLLKGVLLPRSGIQFGTLK